MPCTAANMRPNQGRDKVRLKLGTSRHGCPPQHGSSTARRPGCGRPVAGCVPCWTPHHRRPGLRGREKSWDGHECTAHPRQSQSPQTTRRYPAKSHSQRPPCSSPRHNVSCSRFVDDSAPVLAAQPNRSLTWLIPQTTDGCGYMLVLRQATQVATRTRIGERLRHHMVEIECELMHIRGMIMQLERARFNAASRRQGHSCRSTTGARGSVR